MADFLVHLPRPAFSKPPAQSENEIGCFSLVQSETSIVIKPGNRSSAAPYGHRSGWAPRCTADFGDGGSFPEIHVAQFPLEMGKQSQVAGKTVPLQTGPDGKLQYDAILKQSRGGGVTEKAMVFTGPEAQKARNSSAEVLARPGEEEEEEALQKTRLALESVLENKANAGVVQRPREREPTYIRYTPNQQAPGHNANCAQRVIRLVEKQVDPLEPSKFKNKRVPRGPPSPPPPIQHSPPKKLTKEDQQEWKIPPCVSGWKNRNGYTIPMDKRLQADGRRMQEVTPSDKFANLSAALDLAYRKAREETRERNEMQRRRKVKEEEVRDQNLKELAAKVHADRTQRNQQLRNPDQMIQTGKVDEADADVIKQRQTLVDERKRELERDFRLEKAGKKSRRARDEDRDVSERVALNQAAPTKLSKESMYDSRLFNQSAGLDSGFNAGEDEKNNIYDKPLFASGRGATGLYRFEKDRMKVSVGGDEHMPAFGGADGRVQRSGPVEFEKDAADPFGLDNLVSEAKKK